MMSTEPGGDKRQWRKPNGRALLAVGTKRRLPLLLTGVLFCGAGILRIWQAGGGSSDGYLLAGAALVIIGAWLTMEVQSEVRRLHAEHDPTATDTDAEVEDEGE